LCHLAVLPLVPSTTCASRTRSEPHTSCTRSERLTTCVTKILNFIKFSQNGHKKSALTEKLAKMNIVVTGCWNLIFETIRHSDIIESNAFFSAIKVFRAACTVPLLFKHTSYANIPESSQSCGGWVIKAVLRFRISATSVPEYVSGWCRHGFASNSQPFLLIYSEADLSFWRSNFCLLIKYIRSCFLICGHVGFMILVLTSAFMQLFR